MTIVVGNKKYKDINIVEGIASFDLWENDIFVGFSAMPVSQLSEIIS